MVDGWAVEVSTPAPGGSEPDMQIYFAHISDESEAVAQVKLAVSAASDVKVEAKEQIPHEVLISEGVAEGHVELVLRPRA